VRQPAVFSIYNIVMASNHSNSSNASRAISTRQADGSGANGGSRQTQGGTRDEAGQASQAPTAIPVGSLRVHDTSGNEQELQKFVNYTPTDRTSDGTH
jgi:hypothetical protein